MNIFILKKIHQVLVKLCLNFFIISFLFIFFNILIRYIMFHLLRLLPLVLNYDFKDICKYVFIFLIFFLVYLAFESTQIQETQPLCMSSLDLINKHIFANLFNSKFIIFMFIFLLNLVLSYFIYEMINCNMKFDCKVIDLNDNNSLPRCPFGFDKISGFCNINSGIKKTNPEGLFESLSGLMNIKSELPKREPPKRKPPKRTSPKKEETKKEETKKEETKKEESKKKESDLKDIKVDIDIDPKICNKENIEKISSVLKEDILPKIMPKILDNLKDLTDENNLEKIISNFTKDFN